MAAPPWAAGATSARDGSTRWFGMGVLKRR
jgi:hypothetical protein